MSGRLSQADRDLMSRMVDILLPAAHGMPAGNSVGVSGDGIETVLKLRPDLAADLFRAFRLFEAGGNLGAVEADDEAWQALRTAAFGAYYIAPEIQQTLNYTGQAAQPFDPDVTTAYLAEGLLHPVIARGPIWSEPPE